MVQNDWIVPTVATLLSGTVSGIASKALYNIEGEGDCDSNNNPPSEGHFFAKPFFSVLTMFIGETLCLFTYFLMRWNERRRQRQRLIASDSIDSMADPLTGDKHAKKVPKWVFGILASFDTSGTACVSLGLLYVSASIYQMLRGSAVVFVAFFSMWILKVRLSKKQWIGIGIVVIGLVAVGLSAVLGGGGDAETSASKQMLGILLILFGTALNSLQNVVEEKLLKLTGGAEAHPLEVVGWEGVWGIGISSFILLPIVAHIPGPDCHVAEDTLDTLHMLSKSGVIVALVLSYIVSLALMNFTSMELSRVLTAVHRNLVSALRTIVVWATEVIALWIWPSNTVVGEKLTWYSLIQLFGFVCLIAGTIVYGKGKAEAAMKLPLDGPEIEETYRGSDGLGKVAGAYEDGSVNNGHGDL